MHVENMRDGIMEIMEGKEKEKMNNLKKIKR